MTAPRSTARRRRTAMFVGGLLFVPFVSAMGLTATAPAVAAAAPVASVRPTPLTDTTAAAQAVRTGRAVAVPADTTDSTTTTANPNGTFTLTETSMPTRVLKDGTWSNLDATLRANPDGTLSPVASTGDLILSNGGGGPLATMTYRNQRLALTFPAVLPAPTVSGATATYANVYPSVDLIVTADEQGGFSDVLDIKTAAAAANPALATIVMKTATSGGLSVHSDAAGDLSATTADGAAYFTAGAPVAWDSSVTDAATGTTTPSAATALAPSNGRTTTSTASAPGEAAHVAPLRTAVAQGAISLTPPRSLISSSKTRFPVFVDPTWHTGSPGETSWAEAQYASGDSERATTPYWKGSGYLQVGYDGWTDKPFRSRSYVQFPIAAPIAGSVVNTASVTFDEVWSPTCTPPSGSDGTVQAWQTGSISQSTDWNNKPADTAKLGTNSKMYGFGASCPGNTIEFTASTEMSTAVKAGKTSITFGLQADDETDEYGWKQFSHTATLTVTYDRVPNVVSGESSAPGVGGCQTGSPTLDVIGNNNLTLSAVTKDADGDNTSVEFQVYDYGTSTLVYDYDPPSAPTKTWASGATASVTIPAATVKSWNTNGANQYFDYSWQAAATDPSDQTSAFPAARCHLRYDPTQPGAPGVTVANIDNFPIPATTGTATFTPGTGSAPVSYTYQIDDNAQHTALIGASGCTATTCTVNLPPVTRIGPHQINVFATTAAGNPGPTGNTTFDTVQPLTAYAPGDFDGDGKADLVTVGGTGTGQPAGLWFNKGTGTTTPNAVGVNIGARGAGISSPSGPAEFTSTMVTTGNFTGRGLDDVLVYVKATGTVQIMRGSGDGTVLDPIQAFNLTPATGGSGPQLCAPSTDAVFDSCTTALTGTGAPITLTGLVADGDVDGDGLGPDLLATTSDGHLWYFPAEAMNDGTVQYSPAVVLSGPGKDSATWTGWTITAATSSGQPALYARNNSTGELDLYSSTDPVNNTVGTTGSTKTKVPVGGLTSTAWPVLTGADLNGDGHPDVWASGLTGQATAFALDATTAPGVGPIVSSVLPASGSLCADDSQASTTDGNRIQIHACNATPAQSWTNPGDGTLRVVGKCMEVTQGGLVNGTLIDLDDCNGNGSQHWTAGANGSWINPQSGKCLEDPSPTSDTQLDIDTCNAAADQDWTADGVVATATATVSPLDGWALADNTGTTAADFLGTHPVTFTGAAGWDDDPTRDTVMTDDGLTGYAAAGTGSGVLDTSKSFSVSAWVKLNSLSANQVFAGQSGSIMYTYQLYYSTTFGWVFNRESANIATPVLTRATSTAVPAIGVWTHLVGVFDATGKTIALYVNGVNTPSGNASYTTAWDGVNQMTIGASEAAGVYAGWTNGDISDVEVYSSALTAAQVATIYNSQK
jgi:Concanavalin A-like lectin/glucanases superfamily/Ricin-type beta-trefoil lectin domain